jgi:hypothetical protein
MIAEIYDPINMNTTQSGHTGPVSRLALIGALAAALALTGTASGGASTPSLKLVRGKPLTVRGSGFYRLERVRVAVFASRTFLRSVRTSATGTFTASFIEVAFSFQRCGDGLIISARGARGDVAVLKLPQPECPPPLGP